MELLFIILINISLLFIIWFLESGVSQLYWKLKGNRTFFWWNILDEEKRMWNTWDSWENCYYYYVQHRIFKFIKTIKCEGYRPYDHPVYLEFKNKHKQ